MVDRDFTFVRPYCIQALEDPSPDNIRSLNRALEEMDVASIQQLQEYVMAPLRNVLTSPSRSEALLLCTLECVSKLAATTEVRSWKVFSQTTFLITMIISNPEKSEKEPVARVSDEIKQAVLVCFKSLLGHSAFTVLEKFYSPGFLTQMGYLVFLFMNLAQKDPARDTRVLAMECLAVMFKRHDSDSLRKQAADSLAAFLPGLSVGLTKVAIDGGITGWAVIVHAVDLWTQLICTVLGDNISVIESRTASQVKSDIDQRALTVPERSVKWVASTAEKLLILAQKLTSLDSHSHWRVRMALARWASRIMIECKKSMEECVPVLLGVIITLSLDNYPSISECCRQTLDKFGASLDPKERSLLELLQENFHCTILQLPTIIRRSDDAKKLSILNQLCGYVSIMGPSVNLILNSSSHLEKLSLSLIQLTEFDCDNLHLVSEHTPVPLDVLKETGLVPSSRQRRQFRHFQDEKIALQVYQLCEGIGKWGNLDLLVDHFVDRIHESALYKKQAILLLNEVILGVRQRFMTEEDCQEAVYKTISSICEEYMSPTLWNVKAAHNDDSFVASDTSAFTTVIPLKPVSNSGESLSSLNGNALQVCLLLEGLSNCAEVLRKRFNPLLMKVLYSVMEKMGGVSPIVSHAAFATLTHISRSCRHSSLSDLIMDNADYLLNSLSIKLRYNPTDQMGPTVFRVTLQHGDQRVLNLAEDIVDEVLMMLDTFQNESLGVYLKVLLTLVVAVRKWFPSAELTHPHKSDNLTANNPESAIADIKTFILDYHQLKKESENFCEDADDAATLADDAATLADDGSTENVSNINQEEEDENFSVAEDVKPEVPVHIRIVVKVLQRCGHLLPTRSTVFSVCLMDIINTAAEALQDYENELLPLVHKTWPSIVCKMNDRNPAVLRSAFRTLCLLAKICGDFIHQRLVKDVWPKIIEFLESNAKISINQENHRNFRYSPEYPLIIDLLSNAGMLASSLVLSVVEVDNLSSAAALFLSSRQPNELQQAAITLFKDLLSIQPDLVWLKLNDLYCEEEILQNNANFVVVQLAGCNQGGREFKKNVTYLLKISCV